MARIAGVELPRNKRIEVGLTYIYGIGPFTSSRILEHIELDPATKTDDLTEDDVNRLRDALERLGEILPQQESSYYNTFIEGDLRRETDMNIKRLTDINCYRGTRHRRGLPVRGQRTSTNARTRKGRARTISVGRKAKAKH
ncbi:30S ribosomal protein S13 [Candidatus Poribacteria bacterium]|nr:30S ribosomal protein S13 [Candidatus Poribacteria bacterium]